MQGRGVLMIGLMYVHLCIFGPNLCQSADNVVENFISSMGREVEAIATKAQENYSQQCALARNCTCSRTECHPRKNTKDSPGLHCVYVNNNTFCSTKTNSPCNKVLADFTEGYIRVPPLDTSVIQTVVGKTVCAQKNLDSTFIAVHDNISALNQSTFYNIYFGAVDGSFRFFPGREVSQYNCSTYDPRRRPWYRGAVSVVKDVVVLLDTGFYMRQKFSDVFNSTAEESPIKLAISMTDSVLKTLTATDTATIIPFNESADATTLTVSKTWSVPDNESWPESHAREIDEYLQSVDHGRASNDASTSASNFTAGFSRALSIFNSSGSANQSLKIVILITEENGLPSDQDYQTALEFQKQGIRLFVYEIQLSNASYTKDWASVCCAIDGYKQKLNKHDVLREGPLSSLTSYFTFLARSRVAANNGTINPYWQESYRGASGLGNVITVAHLVMSTDGRQLIGVAGIGFQTAGIVNQTFREDVNDYLTNNKWNKIPAYPNGADFPDCNFSGNVYGDPNLDACNAPNHSLCIEPDEFEPLTDATTISLVCCGDCSTNNTRSWWDKHKTMILSVSLVIPGTVLILMLSTFTIKNVGSWRLSQKVNRPPPANLYSFEEMCEATNDFDDANIINGDELGVLYKARFTNENIVAIKWLGQSADHTIDSQADMQTLNIDGRSSRVKLKGTGFGPASKEKLKGNHFGPTDRFLAYTKVEDGDGHVESEYHIWL